MFLKSRQPLWIFVHGLSCIEFLILGYWLSLLSSFFVTIIYCSSWLSSLLCYHIRFHFLSYVWYSFVIAVYLFVLVRLLSIFFVVVIFIFLLCCHPLLLLLIWLVCTFVVDCCPGWLPSLIMFMMSFLVSVDDLSSCCRCHCRYKILFVIIIVAVSTVTKLYRYWTS
jgi:hypothetical protein